MVVVCGSMMFRDAIQLAFFKMQSARDQYRETCAKLGLVRPRRALADSMSCVASNTPYRAH